MRMGLNIIGFEADGKLVCYDPSVNHRVTFILDKDLGEFDLTPWSEEELLVLEYEAYKLGLQRPQGLLRAELVRRDPARYWP